MLHSWIGIRQIPIQRGILPYQTMAKYSCAKGDSNPHGVTH